MPDDRFFHRRLGHSAKVNGLCDFDFRVWHQYVLSADDFGVMRLSAITVQADNDRLAKAPTIKVLRALEHLVLVGLLWQFEHQDRKHLFQRDWQDWQHVEYPRPTLNPKPPAELLANCSELTRQLFDVYPGGVRVPFTKKKPKLPESFPETSPKDSQTFSHLAGARAPETAKAKANGSGSEGVWGNNGIPYRSPELSPEEERAGRFVERFTEMYPRYCNGARYLSKPVHDYEEAVALCRTWDDERLDKIAVFYLSCTDERNKFIAGGTRTIVKLRHAASWCDEQLRAVGI